MQQIRTWLNNSPAAIAVVIAVLSTALVVIYLNRPGAGVASSERFYFDLNTQRLFIGPGDAMPPIESPSWPANGEPAGVRAHVFACGRCPSDLAGLSAAEVKERGALVHHLETFTPEAHRAAARDPEDAAEASAQFEAMEAGRMVRRPDAQDWLQAESDAGLEVTVVAPCPDGGSPRRCRPDG